MARNERLFSLLIVVIAVVAAVAVSLVVVVIVAFPLTLEAPIDQARTCYA